MTRLQPPSAAAAARESHASHASHAPRERLFLVFAWSARSVRFASRWGGGRQLQPYLCAAFAKR
eukprot:7434880-Lingulodinium_polyedra.AAC.1